MTDASTAEERQARRFHVDRGGAAGRSLSEQVEPASYPVEVQDGEHSELYIG